MRILIVFLISFLPFLSIAEDGVRPYKIIWGKSISVYDGGKSLSFTGANIQNNIPVYQLVIKKKYISKATIINPIYEPISQSDIKLIPEYFSQSDIQTSITYGKERKAWVSKISFTPIRNNNGVWEKLTEFDIENEYTTPSKEKTGNYTWKDNSIFRTGSWYKIGISASGVYKIDRDFITSLGVNPNNINPQNIRIYGNGGEMLPQHSMDTWYDDIDENAIYVEGEGDGKFDTDDYVLFYGQGVVNWDYDTANKIYVHEKNLYDNTSYYYITFSLSGGKRIQSQASVGGTTTTITTFDEHLVHDQDEINVMHSGRFWLGEEFDFELEKTINFSSSGVKSSPGVIVTSYMKGLSPSNTSFQVSLNGANLGTASLRDYVASDYPVLATSKINWPSVATSSSTLDVNLIYNKGGSTSSVGYCDYITLNFQRDLKIYGNQTLFRSSASLNHAVSTFQISSALGATVWDVTDIIDVKEQNTTGSNVLSFSQTSDELREYVVFEGNSFNNPSFIGTVSSQNLHGLTTPDFVIITSSLFKSEANRLADHRTDRDGLDIHVIEVGKIYNEFASGKQDIGAIRNFMKMFYDRDDGAKLKYLLLMGDASYDYKDRIANNTNYIPVYESRNSESPITSYSSDDFYALLDDNEGYFCEGSTCTLDELLDIGVGRIPAKTEEEAQGIVSKIIHYDSEKENIQVCNSAQSHVSGKWRNEVVLIADDSDGNSHLRSADDSIYPIMEKYPDYHVNKIYIDAYEQISGAGGQTAPAVKAEINLRMDRGALIFNYSGHGGELGLSHEGVISVPQINAWDNIDNMPLMFTATCEFGRYDDPERTSGGEYTFLNADGGAVSIVTTTRPVYSSGNDQINRAFFNSVFEPLDSTTQLMPRLGDVMRNAKNGSQVTKSVNNRNFALLGDPSLMLSYPKENVVLTSINNFSLSDTIGDTITALSKVTMEGEIRSADDNIIEDFNGILEASIYDKLNEYITLGDESGYPASFEARDIKIFEGLATISNGKFKFSFIVPKDIKYTYGNGKALFYASSDNLKTNGNGSDLSFIVGGTADNIADDQTPPEISLYMDDETFVNGGTTSESPVFLAKLFDDHGINTTGVGIGHELSSILDDNVSNTLVLNDYYISELDNYQKGIVEYPLEDLLPGKHKITLKAWDTYNNSNEGYLEFIVVNEENLSLEHILNYPNPFTTNTEFHFDHNRVCDDLEIRIQVFTVSGKLIKTINTHIPHASAHVSDIFWDGKDDYGDNIGRGVYVYKVKVRSLTDGSQVHDYQKLVILK